MGHDPALAAITSADVYQTDLPFQEYLLARGLSPKTLENYLRELRYAAAWFEAEGVDINTALPSQLGEYAATRPNTPSVRGHLRSGLRYWWEWRGVKGWPEVIAIPAVPTITCKALEDDHARLLFAKAREIGWRAGTAVEVMLSLALRNEECASMRWDGFSDDMAAYTLVGKKNKQRTLDVVPELAARLDPHRNGSPWVFEGRDRGHVSHQTICNWVKKVAGEAGITERVWPHRLRHTALAAMNDETKDLRTTQDFAGHSRPETTAGYTRTTRKRMKSAAVGLYQSLGGGAWLHSTVDDGRPHVDVGTGDQWGTFRATCDPQGEDSNRPFCWQGPDRDTKEEAIADARAHAPGVEPDVSRTTWQDPDEMEAELRDLLGPGLMSNGDEQPTPVVPLHVVTTIQDAATNEGDSELASLLKEFEEMDVADFTEMTATLLVDECEEATIRFDHVPSRADGAHEADPPAEVRSGPRQPVGPKASAISKRQTEVLALLAVGVTATDDLADRLGVAPKTVKNHLQSIFRKLSVNDRTQALVVALRLGLVDLEMQVREEEATI